MCVPFPLCRIWTRFCVRLSTRSLSHLFSNGLLGCLPWARQNARNAYNQSCCEETHPCAAYPWQSGSRRSVEFCCRRTLGAAARGPGRATGAPSRAGGLPGDEQVSLSVGMRAETPNHAQPCEHRCARAGQCGQNLPHRLRLRGTHIYRTLSTSSEPSRPHCQNRKPQRARKWAFL